MDMTRRLTAVAGTMLWVGVLFGVLSAVLTGRYLQLAPVHWSGVIVWTVLGSLHAASTTFFGARSRHDSVSRSSRSSSSSASNRASTMAWPS